MKIAMVIESGGGSGRHFADLAEGLVAAGGEVSVVYSPERLEQQYVRKLEAANLAALIQLPMSRAVGPGDFAATAQLRRILKRVGPLDVVHGHSAKAGALARLAAPVTSARVYTPHAFRTMDPHLGQAGRAIYGGVEKYLGRTCTEAVIAVSPEEVEHAKMLGISGDRVSLVLNGIDPPPAVDREAIRRELGLSGDDIGVAFVGRFCAQKDPHRFAEAIRIATAADPRIKGVMFGDGELKPEIAALGTPNLTIVSGKVAQDYLPALDIFALTSAYEGMPYVLVEALYAALPIVTTDVGGVAATVLSGENGVVLPNATSSDSFARELIALAANPSTRQAFSQRSLNLSSPMTAEVMTNQTQRVYEQAVDRRRN